ncbi:MAG: alpha-galactosidase [Herbinix sp.]|nr:alpha-galactosidase [Herbinix sp.]
MDQRKLMNIRDFGIHPDTGEDCTEELNKVINEAMTYESATIELEKGIYHIYPENAVKKGYYITNTATKEENPDVTKTIGLFFHGAKNIVLEGNGALLLYHGEMTTMVFDLCENITIKNLHIDFARPTMSEAMVKEISAEGNELTLAIHPESTYEITDGKLIWYGHSWRKQHTQVQVYTKETDQTWRIGNFFEKAESIEELGENTIKLHFNEKFDATPGLIYQFRNDVRTQVGLFITNSSNIRFESVGFHYMHGLGLTAQYSDTITISKCEFVPRKESNRTNAGFADFSHFVGCTGEIKILDTVYCGSHDDCINVHGFHFNVVDRPSDHQAVVRFMHPQSYGYQAFFPGDTVDFNDKKTLLHVGSRTVTEVKLLNEYDTLLTFDGSSDISDSLENASRYPKLTVENCDFSRCPTRAILVTTRKKVVIKNNIFRGIIMPSVFVNNDANYWYESGRIDDLEITDNRFINCANPVIHIHPDNPSIGNRPIHTNIRICENEFTGSAVIKAKCAGKLTIDGNRAEGEFRLELDNCEEVRIGKTCEW